MGWNSHDRAGSVVGQNVVSSPDRQLLAVDRIYGVLTQEDAGLLAVGGQTLNVIRLLDLFEVSLKRDANIRGCRRGEFGGQVTLWRDHHEGCTKQGVWASGVNRDWFAATLDLEQHLGTGRAADPVSLHGDDLRRPRSLESVEVIQ